MHESAIYHGRLFFDAYCPREVAAEFSIVEIGSQNVNGSLREVCPAGLKYTGLDFVEGNGVDLVISDPYKLPLQDASTDILVSSSCFEHSEFFWLVFLEAMRVLKPGGVFYLNVPSNGFFHQWPVDCWRFYPDAGHALVAWGKRNGMEPVLLESFIGRHSAGHVSAGGKWNDFVAVFLKDRNYLGKYRMRIVDCLPEFSNGYSINAEGILRHTARSPDSALMESQIKEIERLSEITNERDERIANLNQAQIEYDEKIANLNRVAGERDGQIANLNQVAGERDGKIATLGDEAAHIVIEKDQEISAVQKELDQILRSRSWRVTAPLRKVVFTVRQVFREPILGRVAERLGIRLSFVLGSTIRQLRASSLFDPDYYLTSNTDVRDASMDPVRHFLLHGWKEHRDPSAAFSTSKYLFNNPDVARARVNPLLHFLRHGHREGRQIAACTNALEIISSAVSIYPFPESHQAVFSARIDSEVEAIRKSGFFDDNFYLSMYPDLQPPPGDLIRHYCERGWREGRNPSDDFNTVFYLTTNSDIRNAGLNPLWHYATAGAKETRQAKAGVSMRYENDIWFGVVETDIQLVAFYASPNWMALIGGRPMFKGHVQPILPGEELGFYDVLDWRMLKRQAQMAKRHGFRGFCFEMHVGMDGIISEQSIERFLEHDEIDIHFCVQVTISSQDLVQAIAKALGQAVSDRRQIRIKNRPVILVKVPGDRQHVASIVAHLRRLLVEKGSNNPFIIGQSAGLDKSRIDITSDDLWDAVLNFPSSSLKEEFGNFSPITKNKANIVPYNVVASYCIARVEQQQHGHCPLYHAVTLGRDNTTQRPPRPLVYTHFQIDDYRRWLDTAISSTRRAHPEDRRFVFVNAWNDWNEGIFLEPDTHMGFSRINETTRALLKLASDIPTPKVSVIVPNYNHESYLRRRLDSIYGQSYKNIEVLLLDDYSSDQSRSVLDQYAADHPNITRKLYNDKNSGSAFRQWSKGIKAATGDLVWIAESDDFCDERFLEVLVRCFDDEAVLLAYVRSVFVDKNEVPMRDEFQFYLSDLDCAERWAGPYVETAHNEVKSALGIKNTIPNASSVLFKRPIDMPLLEDESWLSMRVAGDWVFYLHVLRGGKIAYRVDATNFFRRYEGSTAESTYKKEVFYREVGLASRMAAALYDVPLDVLERCRNGYEVFYGKMVGRSDEEFARWYDYQAVLQARQSRLPNIMVSTMGFYPGGAEILPIRMVNEFKRQGLSVLLLSTGLNPPEDGVRRMLRNDVPLIETSDVAAVQEIIRNFGVEVLNTHQWHIQKYPLQVASVFEELNAHVASLHGMIEHGDAFGVTEEQLRKADQNVTTWVYTAEKNLVPFSNFGLYDKSSERFVKIPNGMQLPNIAPIPRKHMDIPQDAFVLCCVSRAISDKGWEETILAVEQARVLSGRDIRLILVGNGPVYDEYCRVGAPDFVYLAGFSENAVGHYAASDMGIMLTKFKSESFPLTIVDCLFAGKPYIASDVGDIKNMLTIGDVLAGDVIGLDNWEVPIQRAAQIITAFATDKQKYVNALAAVQQVASRYRIDVVAQQYIRLFESNVRRSRSERPSK